MRFASVWWTLPAFVVASLLVSVPVRGQDKVDLEKQPEPVKRATVVYPQEALKKGIEGVVYVGIFVNEKGKVTEAKIEKSDAEVLNKAALD